MERVEALVRILAITGRPRLELTSAVVSADRIIVEVRWYEPVQYFRSSGGWAGRDEYREQCARGDAREGCPIPAVNVRHDFDALTGLPIGKRAPKHMRAAFAAAVAKLDALAPTTASAAA